MTPDWDTKIGNRRKTTELLRERVGDNHLVDHAAAGREAAGIKPRHLQVVSDALGRALL